MSSSLKMRASSIVAKECVTIVAMSAPSSFASASLGHSVPFVANISLGGWLLRSRKLLLRSNPMRIHPMPRGRVDSSVGFIKVILVMSSFLNHHSLRLPLWKKKKWWLRRLFIIRSTLWTPLMPEEQGFPVGITSGATGCA